MGIIKKLTHRNKVTYNLFGITLCKITRNYDYKIKNIAGIYKKIKKYKGYKETRIIKIFNLKIYRRIEDLYEINYSILKIINWKTNKENRLKKDLKQIIKSKYNKIFILKSNLGEAYIFLKFIINGLLNKTDIPLIITTKKYHINLINMLVPEIKSIYKPNLKYETSNKVIKINNKYIYTAFPMKFYIDTEHKIQEGNSHYLSEIYNYFLISKENTPVKNKIKISSETQKKISEYLKEQRINKYIFLSTEATTCENINETFWENLAKELQLKIVKNNPERSIEEAYCLAQNAQFVISLRSGLSEILSNNDNTQIVIYTKFKKRYRFDEISGNKIAKGYSIKELEPNKKNLYEIEYKKDNEVAIIDWIKEIVNMRVKIS